jgi:cytohesin
LVERFLSEGDDPNGFNAAGYMPIHLAASRGNEQVVKMLLDAGSMSNERCSFRGFTALTYACVEGFAGIADLLLRNGAQMTPTRVNDGFLPIHWAAEYGRLEVVKVLLRHGADVNALTESGRTPMVLANNYGHQAVVDYLRAQGGRFRR